MAIDGETLGTDITDAIQSISEFKPWETDMYNKVLAPWQEAGKEIANHVNPEIGGPEAIIPVSSFLNSWSNAGGSWKNAGYYKHQDRVYLIGTVTGGTNNAIFNLPAGYRPAGDLRFATVDGLSFAAIEIKTNGNVRALAFPGATLHLDGISLRSEA
jgi:hypothetical protein